MLMILMIFMSSFLSIITTSTFVFLLLPIASIHLDVYISKASLMFIMFLAPIVLVFLFLNLVFITRVFLVEVHPMPLGPFLSNLP